MLLLDSEWTNFPFWRNFQTCVSWTCIFLLNKISQTQPFKTNVYFDCNFEDYESKAPSNQLSIEQKTRVFFKDLFFLKGIVKIDRDLSSTCWPKWKWAKASWGQSQEPGYHDLGFLYGGRGQSVSSIVCCLPKCTARRWISRRASRTWTGNHMGWWGGRNHLTWCTPSWPRKTPLKHMSRVSIWSSWLFLLRVMSHEALCMAQPSQAWRIQVHGFQNGTIKELKDIHQKAVGFQGSTLKSNTSTILPHSVYSEWAKSQPSF